MWDFFETVRHRHSVRKYQRDNAVETEKLHAVLENICAAPSAGDLQAYHLYVIRNATLRQQLVKACADQQFVAEAPICLVFCAAPQRSAARFGPRGRDLYALQDATIAAAYAQLAAVAAGLATTWVGEFDEHRVAATLQINESLRPIAILSLGYAAEYPEPTPRRKLAELVSFRD